MIIKHFEKWMKKNIDKFKYKPCKVGYGEFRFEGLIDNIVLKLDDKSTEVNILFYDSNGEYHDHIEVDYIEKARNIRGKGYTDTAWIGEYKNRYYPTYKEMIEDVLFKEILIYCDKHFKQDQYLFIVSYNVDDGEVNMAMIGSEVDMYSIKALAPIIQKDTTKPNNLEKDTTIEQLSIFKNGINYV